MLDLLLIHPGGKKGVYQALSDELTAIEPPIWSGLIADAARRSGYSVAILDANAEGQSPEETAEKTAVLAPRLAVIVVYGHQPSASTQHMPASGAISRAIKQRIPDQKILMLGGHVAALPGRTLEEEMVDFVCSGEGTQTVISLLKILCAGTDGLEAVPDLWFRKNNETFITGPAPLISDLDKEMPSAAWDLLPMHLYRAHNWHAFGFQNRQPYASIYTTLGCPYHCNFCCIQAPFKSGELAAGYKSAVNSYRFWSVERVMETVDLLVQKYGVRHLKIADEMFVLNEKHVTAICEALIQRKYGLNIWAYTRIDSIKPDQLPLLKRAGINWLAVGIESANERVRNESSKSFRQDLIEKNIRQIQNAGIHVIANYIFGLPEDDYASMNETLDLAIRLNTEFANFYCAMAYPGSALYDQAVREGWALPPAWSGYSQHSLDTLPLRTLHLTADEVLKFRDEAFYRYFENPDYLEMIQTKFGQTAVDEIKKMTAVKLKRTYAAAGLMKGPA